MRTEQITTGSVTGNVLRLAWPPTLAMALQTAFNIVDAKFVAMVSTEALAAVSLVFPVVFFMFSLAGGIGVGTTSLIARALGAGDSEEAEHAARQSLILFAVVAVIFSVSGLLLQKYLFLAIGATEEMLPTIFSYSSWIFGCSAFLFLFIAAEAILRGEGDMVRPLIAMAVSVVLNIGLDPLLIFGFGPFPELGLTGAALATIISRAVGAVLVFTWLLRGRSRVKLRLRGLRLRLPVSAEILRVGLPTSGHQAALSLGFMALMKKVASFGENAIAAYGLGIRLNQIAILPCLGISVAVRTLVGQNVGRGKLDRAEETTWKAVLIATVAMEAIGVAYYVDPAFWMQLFKSDPRLVAYGSDMLKIVSLSYMFTGVGIVVGAAFQGAGKGLPAFVITVVRLFGLAVPGAYLLSVYFHLIGIWMAIVGASVIAAAISAGWFKLGTWRRGAHLQHEIGRVG